MNTSIKMFGVLAGIGLLYVFLGASSFYVGVNNALPSTAPPSRPTLEPTPTPLPPPVPGFSITMQASKRQASPGEDVWYTITFANSDDIPARKVDLRGYFPQELDLIAVSATLGVPRLNHDTNVVSWGQGLVPAGTNVVISVHARVSEQSMSAENVYSAARVSIGGTKSRFSNWVSLQTLP